MCPLFVISNRRPLAPAALPAFIATMGASDFPPSRSLPRCLGLSGVRVYANKTRRRWDLLGYCAFFMSGSIRPVIPGGRIRLAVSAGCVVACWHLETIGHLLRGHFGTQHLHGRLYPLPLHLACFRAYASSALLPACLQGSIPGLWLAVTRTGLTPARLHNIAQPQPRCDPFVYLPTPSGFLINCSA